MEREILVEIANNIGNDNESVDEVIDKIMAGLEWTRKDEKRWKKLTPEQQDSFRQPDYMLRQIAEIRYAKDNLRDIVYENLKRSQGNLGDKDKMMGLYDTLEKFNYSCPYSDTLLIGGEQPIHLDHIIPVTMGGPTDDWNCIPVCENCNKSKGNRHLLDWWQDNRTEEEEYKLVKIFEHMTSKLLDNSNQIRYVKTEDNIKHLDVITFLKQLLDHIEQNKQYILGPNTSILDDNSKAIEGKLKELMQTFEKVVKKNRDKTLKTDKQYFKEQKQMLKYVKGLGVRSYYKVAYTYFNEIQEMLNNGTSEEEIRQFCFDRDDSFNFTLFYEKLIEYKEKHGSFEGVVMDKEIGRTISNVRQAFKGKGTLKLTQEMIDKLKEIGFSWEAEKVDWFTPFYEKLVKYKEKSGSFAWVIADKEIGNTVSRVRKAYKYIGQKQKPKGIIKLTQEMIDKLKEIGFPWEAEKVDWFTPFYAKLIEYKEKHNGSFVGATQDKEIGKTIGNVRQAYKYKYKDKDNEEIRKSKGLYNLTGEMINKLNAIGFPWEVERVDWFTPFYEKLIEYKENHNGSFVGVANDKEIGNTVSGVRRAYKYKDNEEIRKVKGLYNLTQEMIDKLNAIGFPWEVAKEDRYRDWFTPFYEKLIEYKKSHNGSFAGVRNDKEIRNLVDHIRQAYKGKGSLKLTQEMIDKLNAIGFPWEARAKKVQEDVLSV